MEKTIYSTKISLILEFFIMFVIMIENYSLYFHLFAQDIIATYYKDVDRNKYLFM